MIKLKNELFAAGIFEGDDERYEVVDKGTWYADERGKYQTTDRIVRDTETDLFYSLTVSRSGSYYTEWDYDFDLTMHEVKKGERTVPFWEPVTE